MLENILTNYATFTPNYTVFTANVVWTTLSSPCGTLHKHLARQAPCCIAEQVFCCSCLTFITNLNFVHITALLEYEFSSSSKVTPSQCEMLPPRMCNTLQEPQKHLLFYFHRSSCSPARWYHFLLDLPEPNTVLLLYEIPEGINGFL